MKPILEMNDEELYQFYLDSKESEEEKDVYYKMIQCNISIIIDLEEIIKNKGSDTNIHFICGIIRGSSYFLIDTALTRVPLKILLLNLEAFNRIYDALMQCLLPNRLLVSPFVLLESELNNLIAITEDLCKKINSDYVVLRKEYVRHE